MLDERGVEWTSGDTEVSRNKYTHFCPDAGMSMGVWESGDGKLGIDAHTDYRFTPAQAIAATLGPVVTGDTSDGYHTFSELYHHRAVLFSVIVRDHADLAWKSRLHHDGTMYDGMFIVGIDTPSGQATYHYDIDPYWDMFECRELDRAPEWDGHTPDDAIARISTLRPRTCTPTSLCARDNAPYLQDSIVCSECGAYLCNEFGKVWQAYCPACGAKVRKQ